MIFLLLLLSSSLSLLANDVLEEVKKSCVDGAIYNNESIKVTSEKFPYTIDQEHTKLVDQAYNVWEKRYPVEAINGSVVRSDILREITVKKTRDKLTRSQLFCLIKCSAASVLDYEKNDLTKHNNVRCSYSTGKGVCTEFSRVFLDMAGYFGFKVKRQEGYEVKENGEKSYHSFNVVTLKNKATNTEKDYIVEPQLQRCEVYNIR